MTRHAWNIDGSALRGLYRDRENGWLFGVCAGLSERFNLQLPMVRLVAVICLALFFWIAVAVYIAATLLIREKPLIYSGSREEYEFWRRRHGDYRGRS